MNDYIEMDYDDIDMTNNDIDSANIDIKNIVAIMRLDDKY